MLPKLHPLGKTSIELRRAINRLEIFLEQNPADEQAPATQALLTELKDARSHIPKSFRDPDLND